MPVLTARILNGTEKVAALLLSIDRPIAAQLLRRFEAEEVREVARSAAELGWCLPPRSSRLSSNSRAIFRTGLKFSARPAKPLN